VGGVKTVFTRTERPEGGAEEDAHARYGGLRSLSQCSPTDMDIGGQPTRNFKGEKKSAQWNKLAQGHRGVEGELHEKTKKLSAIENFL